MNIYAYSTETYKSLNWIKVGQTKNEVEGRVKAQDLTANPEELNVLKSWEVLPSVSDHDVHRELLELGATKVRDGREWFETTLEVIDQAVINACMNSKGISGFVPPSRESVRELVNKLEIKLDKLCLMTASSFNVSNALGNAFKIKSDMDIVEGFVLLIPRTFDDLMKMRERKRDWKDIYDSLGIELIFATQKDFNKRKTK